MPQGRHGVSGTTPKQIMIDAGAIYINYELPGQRLLGATRGGNTFDPGRTFREMEVDGSMGRVIGMSRRENVEPVLTVNLLELGAQSIVDAIGGATRTGTMLRNIVHAEYLGEGDGDENTFELENSDILDNSVTVFVDGEEVDSDKYGILLSAGTIIFAEGEEPEVGEQVTASYTWLEGDTDLGTISIQAEFVGEGDDTEDTFTLENSPVIHESETIWVNGEEQERLVDYTITYSDGTITFDVAPALDEAITASYEYDTESEGTHDTITGGALTLDSYIPNVALVGTITGTDRPIVVIVKNVVAEGFELDTDHQDEAVPEIEFIGHFSACELFDESSVWEIRYPRFDDSPIC